MKQRQFLGFQIRFEYGRHRMNLFSVVVIVWMDTLHFTNFASFTLQLEPFWSEFLLHSTSKREDVFRKKCNQQGSFAQNLPFKIILAFWSEFFIELNFESTFKLSVSVVIEKKIFRNKAALPKTFYSLDTFH